MENNSGSNSSIYRRIHCAVSTNPPFRAFRRVSSHQSTPVTADSYYPNLAAKTRVIATNTQKKPHPPQHSKNHHHEGVGIPINFDYSVPTSEGHADTAKGKVAKIGTAAAQNDHGEQQGKKQEQDINDTFSNYIQRAKFKIRSLSNIGGGQSKAASDEDNGDKKNEHHQNDKENHHQIDHFGDFIQRVKKKLRTTSNVGKTNSIKRG